MEKVRVQKYISDCGLMSRRAAEAEIEDGNITVNGDVAYLGMKITPGRDTVKYKGKPIRRTTGHLVYIMLNKPKGYVTTMSDDKGRPCVAELVRSHKGKRGAAALNQRRGLCEQIDPPASRHTEDIQGKGHGQRERTHA